VRHNLCKIVTSMEGDIGEQIRVAVRVRPFNAREVARQCKCCVKMEGHQTILHIDECSRSPEDGMRIFNFDNCYWSHDRSHPNYASQEVVFNDLGQLALRSAFVGYNVCLFAYGQTGSGKSFSMVGSEDDRGIVPRVAIKLFQTMEAQKQENIAFEVVTSMVEIYSEKIRDLLNPRSGSKTELKVREHPRKGPYIAGLTAMPAMNYKEIQRHLELGNRCRSIASTHMNDVSSRAHTIFSINFSQTSLEKLESGLTRETKKVSLINMVDLAGSERQSSKQLSTMEYARFKEGVAINKSLSALANCIFALYK
jgi:kinesin family member 1